MNTIRVHDSLKNRWKCIVCGKTFTASKGTLYYRLKTDSKTVTLVVALLASGCPPQAIVFAFGQEEIRRALCRYLIRKLAKSV